MDLSLIYFPSAVTLGALHALEPGHAKTLTAAYLIGTKGTKRDATLLGLSVAFTHSIVVIGLSVIAVYLGREAFTDEASYYLSVGSSLVVMALGIWLLSKRLLLLRRVKKGMGAHHHSHAPAPVAIKGKSFNAEVQIIDTPHGERFRVELEKVIDGAHIEINISRPNNQIESHKLAQSTESALIYVGREAPAEPHEFTATLLVKNAALNEAISFELHEPEHHHDHSLMSDDEHARAHAASMPAYVQRGERPSFWQIMAFGAAGGLVPCPAAISVMLLSLSLSQSGKGLIMVLGFSLGLAITLVGVGLLIVTGVSKLAENERLTRFTMLAPSIAAGMVIVSGAFGLMAAVSRHL